MITVLVGYNISALPKRHYMKHATQTIRRSLPNSTQSPYGTRSNKPSPHSICLTRASDGMCITRVMCQTFMKRIIELECGHCWDGQQLRRIPRKLTKWLLCGNGKSVPPTAVDGRIDTARSTPCSRFRDVTIDNWRASMYATTLQNVFGVSQRGPRWDRATERERKRAMMRTGV